MNGSTPPDEMAARLRAATELLESVARDRGLLGSLSVEERTRLLSAAADVFDPDVVQRRRFTKSKRKQEKAARIGTDESLLADTGIRVLRDKPVFTTPNVYPPNGFEPDDRDNELPRDDRGAALLRLQAALPGASSVLRPALPTLRRVQLRETVGDRRPRAPCGGADGWSGEDRLPGGDQAAARRRAPHRDDSVSARFSGALRAGAGLRRLERSSRDLRRRPPPHTERGGVLPSPGGNARPARLHRQQRLPDRPPSPGLLSPHVGGGACFGALPPPRGAATARRLHGRAPLRHALERHTRSRRGRARRHGVDRICRALPGTSPSGRDRRPDAAVPRRASRPGPAAGRPSRPQLVAVPARRGVDRRVARDAARERRRPVCPQRPAEVGDAAHRRSRQAHRQRVSRRGAVLPAVQDDAASAHEHGEGGAEHDDAHRRDRLLRRRHPHEQRRHRAG